MSFILWMMEDKLNVRLRSMHAHAHSGNSPDPGPFPPWDNSVVVLHSSHREGGVGGRKNEMEGRPTVPQPWNEH